MDKVGNISHSMSISGLCIYDSNYKKGLPLVNFFLDIICSYYYGDNCFAECEMLYDEIGYLNPKAMSKCEK